MHLFKVAILVLLTASGISAEPLADMAGTWRGSGWARETPQGPKETIRCQIKNVYDAEKMTLKLTGRCVVPGKRLNFSGRLSGKAGSERITGRWSNPGGIGAVRILGIQRDNIVAFNFRARNPATGRNPSQNVEWRVSEDTLHLRSSDRRNPNIKMSDITFTK